MFQVGFGSAAADGLASGRVPLPGRGMDGIRNGWDSASNAAAKYVLGHDGSWYPHCSACRHRRCLYDGGNPVLYMPRASAISRALAGWASRHCEIDLHMQCVIDRSVGQGCSGDWFRLRLDG